MQEQDQPTKDLLTPEEQWQLVEEFKPLVRREVSKVLTKAYHVGMEKDDLLQIANLALFRVARAMDRNYLGLFHTWGTKAIRQALWRQLVRNDDHRVSMDFLQESLDGSDETFPGDWAIKLVDRTSIPSAEEQALPEVSAEELWAQVEKIPNLRIRSFVLRHYRDGETYTQIAASPGTFPNQDKRVKDHISPQRVGELVKKGIKHLQVMLEEEEWDLA